MDTLVNATTVPWVRMLAAENPRRNGESRLWKYADAAEYLQVAQSTVRGLVHARAIPFVKLGKSVRFRPSDLRRWVDQQVQGSPDSSEALGE